MLSRTLAVLHDVEKNSDTSALQSAGARLQRVLDDGVPLTAPVPVDSRVEMLKLELTAEEASAVVELFRNLDALGPCILLDDLQLARTNPWGGFLEAWVEHYNQVTNSSGNERRGDAGMADTEILSEVAGTVWKVLVKEGDVVTEDQELMILESMKMEIPVDAPCGGTVAKVLVAPEEGIEEDQVLLILES